MDLVDHSRVVAYQSTMYGSRAMTGAAARQMRATDHLRSQGIIAVAWHVRGGRGGFHQCQKVAARWWILVNDGGHRSFSSATLLARGRGWGFECGR
jgi:hypothetical protein